MKHWTLLEKALFVGFVATLAYVLGGIVELQLGKRLIPLRWADALLLLLVVTHTHVLLCRQWDMVQARRWSLRVLAVLVAVLLTGTLTGQPFGQFYYTPNFGRVIGNIMPLAAPFLWYVIITGFLVVMRGFMPSISARQEAFAVATSVTIFDWLLEPYTVWVKGYWIWRTNEVPLQNYITWWSITYLLVRLLAPSVGLRWRWEWRTGFFLAGFLAIVALSRYHLGL
jgi:uncharacterized membrane protein